MLRNAHELSWHLAGYQAYHKLFGRVLRFGCLYGNRFALLVLHNVILQRAVLLQLLDRGITCHLAKQVSSSAGHQAHQQA